MDEKQLNLLSILSLQNEDGMVDDYTIDAIYFGGYTIDKVVGTEDDTIEDLTLHGLKNHIDSFVPFTEDDIKNILG